MLSPSDVGDLLDRARAAGCEITVAGNGTINIKPAKNLPPELRSEIAQHKFAVLQRLYATHYRAYYWLDREPQQRELLREGRRLGAAVSLKALDGETSDLEAAEAVGAYIRPGTLGIPEALIPALEAAGFERVEYPEHWCWATSWSQAVGDLVEQWRSSPSPAEQLAVWLATDAADAVTRWGLEPWEGVAKTYASIERNLPAYGRERALRPVLRRWMEANRERDRLRAQGRWLVPKQADYSGLILTPEAEAVRSECERWAWLVVATERLAGNWPWVDPTGWVEVLEGLAQEVAA
ncbi:hypothetical protein [Meiothermus phage MMP17]|nr:dihydroorotase [Meiothermus phage MMP7]QAY18088.1 hypothetical protein [Meiothermus phage MMP17]